MLIKNPYYFWSKQLERKNPICRALKSVSLLLCEAANDSNFLLSRRFQKGLGVTNRFCKLKKQAWTNTYDN